MFESALALVILLGIFVLSSAIGVLREYERGVIFRLVAAATSRPSK